MTVRCTLQAKPPAKRPAASGLAPTQPPPGFLLPREGFLEAAAALGPPYAAVTKRALGGGGTYRGSTAGHT